MESLLLPSKIEWEKGADKNQKKVTIEPFYYGYGTTIGNALRRVLLSSLPGAAVRAVKIKGADHEFSTVNHVAEDVVEIILNLKKLRVKVYSEAPVKLTLKVKGEKAVTAADFDKNSEVEIFNPDLVLATLTDKKAELEMEVTVGQGRGYVPTENQDKSQLTVGEIAVDSIFTPVVNVGYKVEPIRVGQITDFDKLTINLETDGTVTPEEAYKQAVEILASHFQVLSGEAPAAQEKSTLAIEAEVTAESTLEQSAAAVETTKE